MRLLSLKIAALGCVLTLIFSLVQSFKMIFVHEEPKFGFILLLLGCPVLVAHFVVFGYVHDQLKGQLDEKVANKQKASEDCITCGTYMDGRDACPNCGTR